MNRAAVIMQPPRLPQRVFNQLDTGNPRVVCPNLAVPPGADVEDMIVRGFDHAAVADDDDRLAPVFTDQVLDEAADANAEVHHRLTHFTVAGH